MGCLIAEFVNNFLALLYYAKYMFLAFLTWLIFFTFLLYREILKVLSYIKILAGNVHVKHLQEVSNVTIQRINSWIKNFVNFFFFFSLFLIHTKIINFNFFYKIKKIKLFVIHGKHTYVSAWTCEKVPKNHPL